MAENPSNIVPDQIILLEGGSKLVPAPSSSDSGKVLAVLNTSGDIGWAEDREGMAQQQADWAEQDSSKVTYITNKPTIDQTYNASSTNAQSGTAVAGAIANVNQVPASVQADEGKALIVDSNGDPGWSNIPAATVEAGLGLEKSSDTMNVNFGNTLMLGTTTLAECNGSVNYFSYSGVNFFGEHLIQLDRQPSAYASGTLPDHASIYILNNVPGSETARGRYTGKTLSVSQHYSDFVIDGFPGYFPFEFTYDNVEMELGAITAFFSGLPAPTVYILIGYEYNGSIQYFYDIQGKIKSDKKLNVANALPYSTTVHAGKALIVGLTGAPEWSNIPTPTVDQTYNASSTNAQSGAAVAGAISGVKQVPASTAADENKVLAVNAQGTPEWASTPLPEEKSLVSTTNTLSITEGTTTVSIDVNNPLPSTLGTAGQVLTVNSGATGVEWATPSGGDVVVIPLAAAPTGAAIETLFNQVDTAVTANKQVIIKTTNSGNKVRHFALTNTNNLQATGKFYHFNCIEMVENLPNMDAIDHWMVVSYTNFGSDPQYNFTVSSYPIATGISGNSFDPFSA